MTSAESAAQGLHAKGRPGFGRKATLLFAATLTIMAGTTISPSLPAIEAAFANVDNVQLLSRMVLTLPALFVAFCAPLIGSLADRYGRLSLLVASILLYGISGVSGLFADSLPVLLVGRAALGIAIGGIMTLVTALVGDYFAGQERERYLGLQQAFTGLGGVVFVLGGGMLADFHWRAPFAVYALAFAMVPAVILFLNEPRRFAASAPAATGRTDAQAHWLPVAALCLLSFLINLSFYVVPSQLPFYLRAIGTVAPSSAGLALGLHNLVMAGTALFYGRLRVSFGISAIFAIGLTLMALGFLLVSVSGTMISILAAMAICGAGLGIAMPNLMSAAISVATPSTRGRVAGTVAASMFLGHFSSPFASQPWIEALGYATTFRDAGLGLALLAFVSAAAGLFLSGSLSHRR
ncbi:MFS transporter [Mesorhizobium sp. CN2-181]|uniref:MFS transporter n=1 Tax=Mesorhizobium yinganensis TaxID=3157707 RepID=UPI0032B7A16A